MSSEPLLAAPPAAQSPATARETCLLVRDVSKCYEIYARPADRLKQTLWRGRRRFYREFWALRDISIELRRGESLGILGRNGSGKSTLLQIIAGTLRPTSGQVEVKGRVAALLELGSGFNPEFTGRENVFLNGMILGLTRAQVQTRFDEIASFADIGQFLEQPVKTYSSGMVVRLAFAVQAMLDPDILIVDEALAVGDALFQKRCYQKIEQLRGDGVTLLFVSHDLETVRTLTSHVILLHEGNMVQSGSPADVLLRYRRLLHEEEKRYFDRYLGDSSAARPAVSIVNSGKPDRQDASATGLSRSEDLEFGDLEAEVVRVAVLGPGGAPCSSLHTGEKLHIRLEAVVRRRLKHLNFSLRLRNKQGMKVYSWGTLNQDIAIWAGRACGATVWERQFEASERVLVDFECDCPLGPDLYEVQAAVSEERDRYYGAQRILHWRDQAALFQVLMSPREYFFGGLCDMRMRASVLS